MSCYSLMIRTNAASDWVGSCAITIKRRDIVTGRELR